MDNLQELDTAYRADIRKNDDKEEYKLKTKMGKKGYKEFLAKAEPAKKGTTLRKEVSSEILNASSNAEGYYFTFENLDAKSINEILLDFNEQNFNWNISLEGSQEQSEWFTILDTYRILSISNEQTTYSFTKLVFPLSKYRYYRLRVGPGPPLVASVASHTWLFRIPLLGPRN